MIPANLQISSSDPSAPFAIKVRLGTTNEIVEVWSTSLDHQHLVSIAFFRWELEEKVNKTHSKYLINNLYNLFNEFDLIIQFSANDFWFVANVDKVLK